ncbi:MAG: hypothetical protein HOG19_08265 [Gammaproteobacteria bacterium]|nr:hypothetical protein [Gammaproteobacteria bacterium]
MALDRQSVNAQTSAMTSHLNVGSGVECSILELAELISDVVGYQGEIVFDSSKPEGVPRKLLDVTKLTRLGWEYSVELEAGLIKTYSWYIENIADSSPTAPQSAV